jgi:hypothetical protein
MVALTQVQTASMTIQSGPLTHHGQPWNMKRVPLMRPYNMTIARSITLLTEPASQTCSGTLESKAASTFPMFVYMVIATISPVSVSAIVIILATTVMKCRLIPDSITPPSPETLVAMMIFTDVFKA